MCYYLCIKFLFALIWIFFVVLGFLPAAVVERVNERLPDCCMSQAVSANILMSDFDRKKDLPVSILSVGLSTRAQTNQIFIRCLCCGDGASILGVKGVASPQILGWGCKIL